MTVKCVPNDKKALIAATYTAKTLNMNEMADYFKTSTRTIGRVLEERGLATPVPRLKGEAYQVMQLLKEYGLDLETLKKSLAAPAITPNNVQLYLNQCDKQTLAAHFYTSGLVKIAEIAQKNAEQQKAINAGKADPVPM